MHFDTPGTLHIEMNVDDHGDEDNNDGNAVNHGNAHAARLSDNIPRRFAQVYMPARNYSIRTRKVAMRAVA